MVMVMVMVTVMAEGEMGGRGGFSGLDGGIEG